MTHKGIKEIVTFAEALSYCGLAQTATDHQIGLLNQIKPSVERKIRAELECGIVETQYTEFLPKMANPADMRDQIRAYLSPYHIADGGTCLQLSELPVRSVQTVIIDRSGRAGQNPQGFNANETLVVGTDCYLDEERPGFSRTGHLVRVGWAWFADIGSIKVTYTAGYTDRELRGDVEDYRLDASDIRMGTLLTIQKNFALVNAMSSTNSIDPVALSLGGRISSERLGDYSIGYSYAGQMADTKSVIDSPTIPPIAADMLARFKRVNYFVM